MGLFKFGNENIIVQNNQDEYLRRPKKNDGYLSTPQKFKKSKEKKRKENYAKSDLKEPDFSPI